MENLDPTVVLIVGILFPLILAVLNRKAWDSSTKAIVAFLVVGAVGVLIAWLTDHWDRPGISTTVGALYTLAMISFHSLWKPTGVADNVEKTTG